MLTKNKVLLSDALFGEAKELPVGKFSKEATSDWMSGSCQAESTFSLQIAAIKKGGMCVSLINVQHYVNRAGF